MYVVNSDNPRQRFVAASAITGTIAVTFDGKTHNHVALIISSSGVDSPADVMVRLALSADECLGLAARLLSRAKELKLLDS